MDYFLIIDKNATIRKIMYKNLTIYYFSGIGFSELLYHEHANLLNAARSLIEKCPCAYGCPSCVGPTLEVGKSAKEIVPKIIGLILGK